MKSCILHFPKKDTDGITKNNCHIMLTAVAAKIYLALILNHIPPEGKKILKRKSDQLLEKSIHNISNSDYSLIR